MLRSSSQHPCQIWSVSNSQPIQWSEKTRNVSEVPSVNKWWCQIALRKQLSVNFFVEFICTWWTIRALSALKWPPPSDSSIGDAEGWSHLRHHWLLNTEHQRMTSWGASLTHLNFLFRAKMKSFLEGFWCGKTIQCKVILYLIAKEISFCLTL